MSSPPKIIIADDIAANRIALKALLKKQSVELLDADSGNAVLMLALKHTDTALILLDVQMPGMDGYEAAELLRGEEKTRNIPIIFLTALNHDEEHMLKGYSAGGIDYIQKPLIPEILLAKVGLFVELWQVNQRLMDEVSSRREAEKEINHMAMHDQLTQLPNRAQLQKNLEFGIARVNRYGGKLAVIFLDLDGFKPVNDAHGHEAGDHVLKVLGQRFLKMMRPTDTVCRFGGDEFVIVMTDLESVDDIKPKLKAIIEATKTSVQWQGITLNLSSSVGVSLYPGHGKDGTELIKSADSAMYKAKNCGKQCFKIFEAGNSESIEQMYNKRLLAGLEQAVDSESLDLHYQPIVDAATFKIVAVEALLRWNSKEFGNVEPMSFIPLAEDSDLIEKIQLWALRRSLEDSISWWKQCGEKIRAMVNVTSAQIGSFDDARSLDYLLRDNDLSFPRPVGAAELSDFIGLEVQENCLSNAVNQTAATLSKIRSQGIGVSVDNFGEQGLGLKFLSGDMVSTIKIGRSTIQQISTSLEKRKLIKAIVSMAHIFEFNVIALGVETKEQLEYVQEVGCDYVQGFYFSEALDSEDLLAYINQYKQKEVVC